MPKRKRQSKKLQTYTEEDLKYAKAAGLLYHVAMNANMTDTAVLEVFGYQRPLKVSKEELEEIVKLLDAPPEPTPALLKAAAHWREEVNAAKKKG